MLALAIPVNTMIRTAAFPGRYHPARAPRYSRLIDRAAGPILPQYFLGQLVSAAAAGLGSVLHWAFPGPSLQCDSEASSFIESPRITRSSAATIGTNCILRAQPYLTFGLPR